MAATMLLSTLIATGAVLLYAPLAGADEPAQPGGQGQEACAAGDQSQTPEEQQQQQLACGAGIANRAVNEAKNAADQANRAANQANQNGPSGDRPPQDMITNTKCVIFNGVPTLIPPEGLTRTATPFDSPMEGKPCWAAYGVTPTH
ncbi:hypothetical protein [Mycolicibacter arupensis]|uniref:Secreted protein n=1 Tax=Mycolicibacter arupensis TaxID=342002 RepID=A0A0F5MUK0_9MYCO|nr:hypothetical protein [Mycolicibacter arupensis]KKB98371.1 hypothetical protein WR43_14805 [Mycolicibacter arupensis]MCV7276511.1 hypothetical protein [Mycolicibacter arupensis]OQZ97170.1 hypothetical protein BST15_10860 [Mycolicibacter arupensis]